MVLVHGIKCRASSFNTNRIDSLYQDPHSHVAVRFKSPEYTANVEGLGTLRSSIEKKDDEKYPPIRDSHVNIGTRSDISIKELGTLLINIIGYKGQIQWNASKPDGAPRKLLNVNRIAVLGWQASTTPVDGVRLMYQSYIKKL